MKLGKILAVLLIIFTTVSCEPGPVEMRYGSDSCAYCKMTIVDQQHAAQLVTQKGKAHKFDAIECMLGFNAQNNDMEVALHLACNYADPGQLVDVKGASFLISESIPSPMGAYLSAFGDQQDAMDTKENKGGELYNWQELISAFDSGSIPSY